MWAATGTTRPARAVEATRAQPGDRSERAFRLGLESLLTGLAGLL
ncbi:hypothetical protein [Kineosporia corallincola]|nr:hypothetical protein [Kineosporia corallincola]